VSSPIVGRPDPFGRCIDKPIPTNFIVALSAAVAGRCRSRMSGAASRHAVDIDPLRTPKDRSFAAVGGLSPVFWVIWWGVLVHRMANFVGIFLALYLRQQHDFDEAQTGWVVGLWGLGGTIAAPIGGAFADRIGRRSTMLLGHVLGALSVVAIAFAGDPLLLTVLAFVTRSVRWRLDEQF
jgi:hypothetical protein